MLRVLQLYSFFFLGFFDYWPTAARSWFTPLFTFSLGSFHIWSQDKYYNTIESMPASLIVTICFTVAMMLVFTAIYRSNGETRLRYRMEHVYVQKFNWFRWSFWFCELTYLPFLANIAFFGNCVFISERDAISPTTCDETGGAAKWFMKLLVGLALVLGFIYNLMLFDVIKSNRISNTFHEESVQKKEIEYELGINQIWVTGKFYTFSSFRSGLSNMYHRIVFNYFVYLLVLFYVIFSLVGGEKLKATFMVGLSIVFTIYCIIQRPYRSNATNLTYCLVLIGFTMQAVFIRCVVVGYRQAIFVDKYFFQLTLILNGLVWFLVMVWILFCMVTKMQWPINKTNIYRLTEG